MQSKLLQLQSLLVRFKRIRLDYDICIVQPSYATTVQRTLSMFDLGLFYRKIVVKSFWSQKIA